MELEPGDRRTAQHQHQIKAITHSFLHHCILQCIQHFDLIGVVEGSSRTANTPPRIPSTQTTETRSQMRKTVVITVDDSDDGKKIPKQNINLLLTQENIVLL
jgi:hypothetical protein